MQGGQRRAVMRKGLQRARDVMGGGTNHCELAGGEGSFPPVCPPPPPQHIVQLGKQH